MSKPMPLPPKCALLNNRSILRLTGPDALPFLQGMVSQDVTPLTQGQLIFTAFLTPQGKYLDDFFVLPNGEEFYLDVEATQAVDLAKRFLFYKTRARIDVQEYRGYINTYVFWDGVSDYKGAMPDLRLPRLGQRLMLPKGAPAPTTTHDESDYREHRLRHGVAEGTHEIEAGQTILLEANFDKLNGVSFKKGCYMGQELTARTYFRGLIKKRYLPFRFEGIPPVRLDNILDKGFGVGTVQAIGNEYGLGLFHLDKVRPFVEENRPLIHDGITFNIFLPPFLDGSVFHSAKAHV